eukprot:g71445.t1
MLWKLQICGDASTMPLRGILLQSLFVSTKKSKQDFHKVVVRAAGLVWESSLTLGLEGKSTHGRTRMCLAFLSTHPGRGKLFQEEALIFRFRRCSWWTRTAPLHQAVVGGVLISSSCSTQRLKGKKCPGRKRMNTVALWQQLPYPRTWTAPRQDLDEKHCGLGKQPTVPDPQSGDKPAAWLAMEKKPSGFLKMTREKRAAMGNSAGPVTHQLSLVRKWGNTPLPVPQTARERRRRAHHPNGRKGHRKKKTAAICPRVSPYTASQSPPDSWGPASTAPQSLGRGGRSGRMEAAVSATPASLAPLSGVESSRAGNPRKRKEPPSSGVEPAQTKTDGGSFSTAPLDRFTKHWHRQYQRPKAPVLFATATSLASLGDVESGRATNACKQTKPPCSGVEPVHVKTDGGCFNISGGSGSSSSCCLLPNNGANKSTTAAALLPAVGNAAVKKGYPQAPPTQTTPHEMKLRELVTTWLHSLEPIGPELWSALANKKGQRHEEKSLRQLVSPNPELKQTMIQSLARGTSNSCFLDFWCWSLRMAAAISE